MRKIAPSHSLSRAIFDASVALLENHEWLRPKSNELDALIAFCPTDDHRAMVINLLHRTRYISGDKYFDIISSLKDHIEDYWKLIPEETVFVAAGAKDYTDSSQEVLNQVKSCAWDNMNWSRRKFLTSYASAAACVPTGGTIVIVDDFIGSGGSMFKTIAWFKAESHVLAKPFNIKIISVAACDEGIKALRFAKHDAHSSVIIRKGLSDYLSDPHLTKSIGLMNDLEEILSKLLSKKSTLNNYRFGWGRQEAMYVRRGGNTPNNVFPIFWWHRTKRGRRKTIMHRTA